MAKFKNRNLIEWETWKNGKMSEIEWVTRKNGKKDRNRVGNLEKVDG